MKKHTRLNFKHFRLSASQKKNFVPLIVCMVLAIGMVSASTLLKDLSGGTGSPEVKFTDASRGGLSIVPASGSSIPGKCIEVWINGNGHMDGHWGTECCPDNYTGTPPYCVAPSCPSGYSGVYPNCVAPSCPSGYTGVYPNCIEPSCPTGYIGTYPNCVPQTSPAPTATITSSAGPTIQEGQSTIITLSAAAGTGDSLTGTQILHSLIGTTPQSDTTGTVSPLSYTFSSMTAGAYKFHGWVTTKAYPAWLQPAGTHVEVTVVAPPAGVITSSLGSYIHVGDTTDIQFDATPGTNDSVIFTRIMENTIVGGTQTKVAAAKATGVSYPFSSLTTGVFHFHGQAWSTVYPTMIQPPGASLTVTVIPSGVPTPTPTPTPTNTCHCPYGCYFNGTCLPPPIPIIIANLIAHPTLLKSGSQTTISWAVGNVTSCTVTAPNNDPLSCTGTSCGDQTANTHVSNPITAQTIFTLNCVPFSGALNPDGSLYVWTDETATVNIVPQFHEH